MVIKSERLTNYFSAGNSRRVRHKERADCVGPPSMVLCAERKVAREQHQRRSS